MPHNDSYNFKQTGIYDRIKALVGGNEQRIETWWKTPLSPPPFNLRTPEDLMNDNEWRSVRDYIVNTISGDYISDNDFKAESEKFGYLVDINKVFKLTDKTYGYGGTESKIYVYNPGDKPFDIPVYRVHTFTSSGQIRFEIGGEVEYLIVGGGGGGGGGIGTNPGGGGGGGGVLVGKVSVQPGTYDIVVGAGGTGGSEYADQSSFAGSKRSSSNGQNSSFWKFVAYGGGAGGHSSTNFSNGNPLSGATGGGGSPDNGTAPALTGVVQYNTNRINGAPAIYGDQQGYAGGNGISVTQGAANPAGGTWGNTAYNAGGGGGAGGPGGNATNLKSGDGGIGKLSDITGTPTYYGGGGGGGCYGTTPFYVTGGAGGLGGGATTLGYVHLLNNANYVPSAGVANTGGGGGGGFSNNAGSSGGSGIVVIRYRLTI